ncbi:hypothetical protein GCM10022226_06640 [Sphaerisporangium flaviroseum]|uniref:CU044_5270 family protein n=1 Tax=Sphaerisporangium flaviroseum TaxID=509199 RepID=A0ABP7HEV9_9ACTN
MDDLSAVREEVRAVPGPSQETVARGRARLHAHIARERAPRRSPRLTTVSMGLAGAAAAAALVLSSAAPPSLPAPVRPTAQQILLAAATSVAKQPNDGAWWGNNLVRGIRVREPGNRYTLQVTASEETWIPVGKQDSHWIVRRYLGARPATPQDEAAWQADGSPSVWPYQNGAPGTLLGADPDRLEAAPGQAESHESADVNWRLMFASKPLTKMDELPASPEKLRALLEPAPGDVPGLLENLASLIVYVPVPSEVRAAAYQLMASLPGVTAQGRATDQLGRSGQAVVYRQPDFTRPDRAIQTRLIVDSATGAPLAVETLTPDSGELIRFTAVKQSTWTDQKPDLPNPHPLKEGN